MDEVRGQSSYAVFAGIVDTAFAEAAKELPAWGVQKTPRGLGEKQFLGGFLAAPDYW
jgi:hypothetical protein